MKLKLTKHIVVNYNFTQFMIVKTNVTIDTTKVTNRNKFRNIIIP